MMFALCKTGRTRNAVRLIWDSFSTDTAVVFAHSLVGYANEDLTVVELLIGVNDTVENLGERFSDCDLTPLSKHGREYV